MSIANLISKNVYNISNNSETLTNVTSNPGSTNTLWSNGSFSPPHIFFGSTDLSIAAPGPTGEKGEQGAKGDTGSQGEKGNTGSSGSLNAFKGDLTTYSTTNVRLPVGPDGSLLMANSGVTDGLQYTGGVLSTNTFLGMNTATSLSGGIENTFYGCNVYPAITSANANTAVGCNCLKNSTTCNFCTGYGYNCLVNNTVDNSCAYGSQSMQANTGGSNNTSVGYQSMLSNTTGNDNTSVGFQSLYNNISSSGHVSMGYNALYANTSGQNCTAIGSQCLTANTIGQQNTGVGSQCLMNNTTAGNCVGLGFQALASNTIGNLNTGIGYAALASLSGAGNNNIGLGYSAGSSITGAQSNNICIGSTGSASDSNIIRLGTPATQTSCYIAGIDGVTVASGTAVLVNSSGQLGTVVSSERFKENIVDLSNSDKIYDLRPVEFDYKVNGLHSYGLIAEEVDKVLPELVIKDDKGQASTVAYHLLVPFILNELIKLKNKVDSD